MNGREAAALDRTGDARPLLPCPFCGATSVSTHEGSTFRWMYAACNECGAQSGEVRVQTLGSGTLDDWAAQGQKDAIAEWNTRADHAIRQSHAELLEALKGAIFEYDRNTCTHEETHRGGAIWTICDWCGAKWADDRGGFVPYTDPPRIKSARAAVANAEKLP